MSHAAVNGYSSDTKGPYFGALSTTGFPSGYAGSYAGKYPVGSSAAALYALRWSRVGTALKVEYNASGSTTGPWTLAASATVPSGQAVVVGCGEAESVEDAPLTLVRVSTGPGTLSCGVGECLRTVSACVNGQANPCTPAASHPETCDGLDNDCDGVADNGDPGSNQACSTGKLGICAAGTTTYHRDADGDGYGNANLTTQACSLPAGSASNSADCDDTAASAHPGGTEVCNGFDDDCDGQIDEGNPGGNVTCGPCSQGITVCSGGVLLCSHANLGLATYHRDADGDGHGNAAVTTQACSQPSGYLTNSTDCDDSRATVYPGATETCNGLDDSCDGQTDEGNPGGGVACSTGKQGVCAAGTTACMSGAPACNQNVQSSTELCDGLDNNCDGTADDGAAAACPSGANSTATCVSGACGLTCSTGYLSCDGSAATGCERALNTDASCGTTCANTTACTTSQTCSAGACVTCATGYRDCDGSATNGCEEPINTDASRGTSCTTTACTTSQTCSNGACTACTTGLLDCDGSATNGCEVNKNTDANNCGSCGKKCTSPATCANGTCTTPSTTACGTANEGYTATVTCPTGKVVKTINFASYGTPNGSCGGFTLGSCNSGSSTSVVSNACLNKNSCSVGSNNSTFGDPCVGTYKRLYIQVACQ